MYQGQGYRRLENDQKNTPTHDAASPASAGDVNSKVSTPEAG